MTHNITLLAPTSEHLLPHKSIRNLHKANNRQDPTMSSIRRVKQANIKLLPAELWLQIFEQAPIIRGEQFWTRIRHVSLPFKSLAETSFISPHLPHFAISLSLPRLHPENGVLKWGYSMPWAQITMSFNSMAHDGIHFLFVSPIEVLIVGNGHKTIEELKETGALPLTQLRDAPVRVMMHRNYMFGCSLEMPKDIRWDDELKWRVWWVWWVEWRTLVGRFYQTRAEARYKKHHGKKAQP